MRESAFFSSIVVGVDAREKKGRCFSVNVMACFARNVFFFFLRMIGGTDGKEDEPMACIFLISSIFFFFSISRRSRSKCAFSVIVMLALRGMASVFLLVGGTDGKEEEPIDGLRLRKSFFFFFQS